MPDIIVKNQSELDAAIKAAKGGETIKLAAGSYTNLTVMNKSFASNVTITSLDPNSKVNVSVLTVASTSNLTVQNLDVKRTMTTDTLANLVHSSSNIVLDKVGFSGGTGDPSESIGVGLQVRNGTNIKITNSSFDHFAVGLAGQTVDGMLIKDSSFHDNRRDHTNFLEMKNTTIDSNSFTNLFPVGTEHPDAIQFWTANSKYASSNVTITNNVIMQGAGRGSQGIFIGGENPALIYDNLNISNNMVYSNGWSQGISVSSAKNVTLDSNSVMSKVDGVAYWIQLNAVDGAKVTNNIADSIIVASSSKNIEQSKNVNLGADLGVMRSIAGLNDVNAARIADLLVSGVGYQPPKGSVVADLVQSQLATAKPATSSLLLDLSFNSTGLVDKSRWASSSVIAPIDLTKVSGNSFRIQTGVGVALDKNTSKQIYGLSAFTISFDLKRDAPTAAVGDIMSIYRSWTVSLRADGELVFAMENASGKGYSVATTGAKLTDANNHKIAFTYDSQRSQLLIYVDGVQRGSGLVTGTTKGVESGGLYIGGQFSKAVSGTVGDIEIRDTALSAPQVQSLSLTGNPASADAVKYNLTQGVVPTATSLATGTGSSQTLQPAPTLATNTVNTASAQAAQLMLAMAQQAGIGAGSLSSSSSSALLSSKLSALQLNHA